MIKLLAAILAFVSLSVQAQWPNWVSKPAGGSVVLTDTTTTTASCTAGGVLFSASNTLKCNDTDLTFNGTTLTATGLTVTNAPTFSALTTTRIPFAGTAGLLGDSANLIFDGTSLLTVGTSNQGAAGWKIGYGGTNQFAALVYSNDTVAAGNWRLATDGGTTILNAPTGSGISLRVNNSEKFLLGFTAGRGFDLTAGTAASAVSALSLTQTWNFNTSALTGVLWTFTDTSSHANTLAFQILCGASGTTNCLSLSKAGLLTTGSSLVSLAGGLHIRASSPTLDTVLIQDIGSSVAYIVGTSGSFIGLSASDNNVAAACDTCWTRVSAGVWGAGTGAAASVAGSVQAATFTAGTAHDTADGSAAAVGYRFGARANYGIFFSSGSGTVSFSNNSTVEATMNAGIVVRTGGLFSWSSGVPGTNAGDTAFSKISAGIVGVGTGAAGSVAGGIQLATLQASPVSTVLTLTAGAIGMGKMTASASAPGATGGKLELVCGTNAGSAKLIVAAGTSATAVTVVDNIGSGVSGC